MNKLLRIVLTIALGLWTVPLRAEVTIGDHETIGIIVSMPSTGVGDVNVEIRNRTDDGIAAGLGFNAGAATLVAPWIASGQYLDVDYSATYNATWGVRIVTDNEDLEGDANDTIDTLVAADASADPGVQALYSGLVTLAFQDPSRRAALAWQVYAAPQGAITVPSSTIAPDPGLGGTVLLDKNTPADAPDSVGPWNAAWAYLADKNNYDYNGDILEAANDDNGDGVVGGPGDSVNDPTYCMVLVGPSGGGNGTLAPHPQKVDATGNPDGIAIYLAARFANTNWGNLGDAPTAYVLPAGAYSASLYIELVHE